MRVLQAACGAGSRRITPEAARNAARGKFRARGAVIGRVCSRKIAFDFSASLDFMRHPAFFGQASLSPA